MNLDEVGTFKFIKPQRTDESEQKSSLEEQFELTSKHSSDPEPDKSLLSKFSPKMRAQSPIPPQRSMTRLGCKNLQDILDHPFLKHNYQAVDIFEKAAITSIFQSGKKLKDNALSIWDGEEYSSHIDQELRFSCGIGPRDSPRRRLEFEDDVKIQIFEFADHINSSPGKLVKLTSKIVSKKVSVTNCDIIEFENVEEESITEDKTCACLDFICTPLKKWIDEDSVKGEDENFGEIGGDLGLGDQLGVELRNVQLKHIRKVKKLGHKLLEIKIKNPGYLNNADFTPRISIQGDSESENWEIDSPLSDPQNSSEGKYFKLKIWLSSTKPSEWINYIKNARQKMKKRRRNAQFF